MNLRNQKRLASQVSKKGLSKVKLDPLRAEDIKTAITKADIKSLIKEGAIKVINKVGVSRARARKKHEQKRKGRQKGHGKRKGTAKARTPKKRAWINKIRPQRELLKTLRDSKKISTSTYRNLYGRSKGGFFRSRKHLLQYMNTNKLFEGKK
jgi:large subunit ribosomal protein L19e